MLTLDGGKFRWDGVGRGRFGGIRDNDGGMRLGSVEDFEDFY